MLAERMGLSLTLTATEVPVGECLGQLLVYASGLEAVIVVWVAPAFRDDHRRTLDWLNERTDEGVSFFGVEPARSSDITYAFASGTAALEATEAADIYDREAATDRSAAIDRLLADQGVTVVAACDQGRGRATCCSRLSRRVE